jgi:ABC-type lipoprotein export system ATPase subunit
LEHAVIELRDLFRVVGGVAALQGLTLDVAEGEICVVLGPSGSGKTTMLRILSGLDRPSAGRARVDGTDLSALSSRALGRYRAESLGYADQHYWQALAPELSIRENVGLRLGLAGRPRGRRADELLERVGLLERREARPAELSGGEQQRVAVCAALAHRPRLLVADEPTGELDAASAREVFRLIRELARNERCTVVLVSHDPTSAEVADRVVHIRDGRVAEEADAAVVGRGGWLRVPEELLRRAGIADRARVALEGDAVVLRGDGASQLEAEGDAAAAGDGPVAADMRGVTVRYDGAVALQELGATFRAGRMAAVTGPSGSGKTTLLNVLAGLQLPDEGEVDVLGTTVSRLDRAARARFRREHVGFLAQQPVLSPLLTARETVELGLELRRVEGGALDALERCGVAGLADRRVAELSSGERERVALARALAPGPGLVIADEPTSRLDQANALAAARLLLGVARETGAAVVCASHDPILIELADNVVALG